MNRHEKIRLTLEQIKVAKKLVAQQIEFIFLAKAIGYEPIHATATLQRFCAQLSDQRKSLVQLTRTQKRRVAPASARFFARRAA